MRENLTKYFKGVNFDLLYGLPSQTKETFSNTIELTKKLNNVLENMIRKNPGQWIWTHNRWK